MKLKEFIYVHMIIQDLCYFVLMFIPPLSVGLMIFGWSVPIWYVAVAILHVIIGTRVLIGLWS